MNTQLPQESGRERRKHTRIFFTPEQNVTGKFLIPGIGQGPINALILNLSMGGLYFTPEKGRDSGISAGNQLVFMHLFVPQSDPLVLNIDAEIKWILDPAILEHIGIGCSFIKLSSSSFDRLQSFLNASLNFS